MGGWVVNGGGRWVGGWMDGRWIDRRMGGWVGGWMDGWVSGEWGGGGWMDGRKEGRKDRWRTSCLLRQLQDRRSTRTWCGSCNKSPCFLKPFTENGGYRSRFLRRSPVPSTQNKASLTFSHLNLTSMERHWLPSLSPLYRQEYQGSERLSDSPTVTQLVWDAVRLTTPSRSHSLMLQRTHRRTTRAGESALSGHAPGPDSWGGSIPRSGLLEMFPGQEGWMPARTLHGPQGITPPHRLRSHLHFQSHPAAPWIPPGAQFPGGKTESRREPHPESCTLPGSSDKATGISGHQLQSLDRLSCLTPWGVG